MKRVIIDRFENGIAICEKENKTMIPLERSKIPPEAKEGDCLIIDGDIVTIDKKASDERKHLIEESTKDLWT